MENCNDSEIAPLVQIGSMICWFAGTAWWMINCRCINQRYAKPVHLILSSALVFRCIEQFFRFLVLEYCASDYVEYYGLGVSSAFTLFNTFLYTILLLMSKGLSLTREYLERNEVSIIALTMGAIYLGFSAYTIDKENLKIVLILMLGVLWYTIYTNSSKIVSILEERHQMMRVNNLTRTLEAIKTKISMMKLFNKLTSFLCISQLICVTVDFVFGIIGYDELKFAEMDCRTAVGAAMDLSQIVAVLGICVVFMPRFRGEFFDTAEFDDESGVRGITPMYEAVLPPQEQEVGSDKPIVLVKPCEGNGEGNVLNRIMIAIPMTQTYGVHVGEGLLEPLLSHQLK